jgi:DNA-binding FrmR family transcriptional regulator
MIENKKDYFAVMQQSKAVQGGLEKLNKRILMNHINNHTFNKTTPGTQKNDLEKIKKIVGI